MKLLFFVFNRPERMDDLLAAFTKYEIKGATIVDSMGMVHMLNNYYDEDELPFLGAVRAFLKSDREKSNLILAAMEDEKVPDAVAAIESVVGDLSAKDTGVVFTVPIDFVKGLYKNGK
ncbi:MAG: hypothetical protein RSC69_06615 [Lachnospiraceae bacterium]